MTELEKLEAGLPFCFTDPAVEARKNQATAACDALERIPALDAAGREAAVKALFGATGQHVSVQPGFHCDSGKNIFVGEEFTANYNVTILDIAPVRFGDYCMVGPNTIITAVNHPMDPMGRRAKLSIAKPVTIGNDVWFGANCVVLPGVTIGDNVVVAAGAVVTRDIPANSLAAGVPARAIKTLEDNTHGPELSV